MEMKRIKVINEPTELVPILRAVDSAVQREVFKEVARDWVTMKAIEAKYGKEGKDAIMFFERMKLVESKWEAAEGGTEKAFHSYYVSFHINLSCPVTEIADILSVATMDEKDYKVYEKRILKIIGEEGKFAGDIAEELQVSPTFLRSLIKRSVLLEYRGHRVEKFKE